jgi:predicted  nucleic acid-binding Zn-ribbon protein
MSSTGQARLAEARAQIASAEITLAAEHFESLKEQLKAALSEGRRIDAQLEATGARLVEARRQAEPLWQKRDAISKSRLALDESFQANDFPTDKETTAYEQRREELTDEWHRLTAEITPLSNTIGKSEDEFRGWKVARGRAEIAVRQVRQALADTRRVQQF